MPDVTILLFRHSDGPQIAIEADQAAPGQPADAKRLTVTAAGITETLAVAGTAVRLDPAFLEPVGGVANTYRLRPDPAASKELIWRAEWGFTDPPRLFGR